MNETLMTVRGNVVDAPTLRLTRNGHTVANFRVASTQRRLDREAGEWVDGSTLFVSVSAWRGLGQNAAESLRRGQPVVVYGRYHQRDYVKDELQRTSYELDAIAIGHDLSRGVAEFERRSRAAGPAVDVDEAGVPRDCVDEYPEFEHSVVVTGPGLEIVAADGPGREPEVDVVTGEVREAVARDAVPA